MAGSAYHICKKCVMDTSDPDITFDNEGICKHCLECDALSRRFLFSGDEGRRRLEEIVKKIKAAGKNKKYDCLIGVSGGGRQLICSLQGQRGRVTSFGHSFGQWMGF